MQLSHPWGFVLSAAFAMSWLDVVDEQDHVWGWLPTLSAALTLGVLAISRPLTALGVATPFAIHAMILVWRGPTFIRHRLITLGLVTLLIVSTHFLWQFAVTGDPQRNPYTLWWEFDKIGFGPGYGVLEGGHSLRQAFFNTWRSLVEGAGDLFGWSKYSWVFIPFGLWTIRRKKKAWLLFGVPLGLIVAYLTYWVSGARYFYEGLYGFTLISAAGIAWLAGWIEREGPKKHRWKELRTIVMPVILVLLVAGNLIFYTHQRLMAEHTFYEVDAAAIEPFLTSEADVLVPAIILVHAENWRDYAILLNLADPFLETPFIFAWTLRDDARGEALMEAFPERALYHYFPGEPGLFTSLPNEP